MKWVITALIVLTVGVVILPLRLVSEITYVDTPQPLQNGTIGVEFDPHFSEWFAGLNGNSPYRVRVTFKPTRSDHKQFEVRALTFKSQGRKILGLSPRVSSGSTLDTDGKTVFTVGYLDVPLDQEVLSAELVVAVDDAEQKCELQLRKVSSRRLVHAGLEALNGL